MSKTLDKYIVKFACLLCLLFPVAGSAGQFVDITAEIEVNDWAYHFLVDGRAESKTNPPSIFESAIPVHCVVGSNSWFMERTYRGSYSNHVSQSWFTGTNLVSAEKILRTITEDHEIAIQSGFTDVDIWPSIDGNPGRPLKQQDFFMLDRYIPWIAFCSGPALKKDHHLYPPMSFWKEMIDAPHGFSDRTTVFKDGFGLPISVKLFAETSQTIFQYQVHQTTNVLGWNFPLEFYMVQYEPDGTNGWVASFTARGRITAIGLGAMPQIPESILKTVKKTSRKTF